MNKMNPNTTTLSTSMIIVGLLLLMVSFMFSDSETETEETSSNTTIHFESKVAKVQFYTIKDETGCKKQVIIESTGEKYKKKCHGKN